MEDARVGQDQPIHWIERRSYFL